MIEKSLLPLFSKPIFKTSVNVTNVNLEKINWARNYHNWISSSQDVLSDPDYLDLLNDISVEISEYFYGIMCANKDVEIYITESWFNKTEKGQCHHRHWHPNSILSGVVFIESDDTSGRIKFVTNQFDTIEYNTTSSNLYNSKNWSIDPTPGTMLLFPSNVEHLVDEYYGDIPRISLAFNTFVRGNINIDPLVRLNI